MALKRRSSYTTTGLASLGLCLSLSFGVAFYLSSGRTERPRESVQFNFGDWLNRSFYQIGAEIKLWLGYKHVAAPPGKLPPPAETENAPFDPAAALGLDLTGLREALALYKAGDLAEGDQVAETARDPLVRTTLAWVALRALPHERGFDRMESFLADHPGWPARDQLERHMEEMLYVDNMSAERIEDFFFDNAPETVLGKLALARAFKEEGDEADARRLVRAVWHKSDLGLPLEAKVKTEFAAELDKEDSKTRADYLLYKGDNEGGLRAAQAAGAPVLALAKLRIAAHANAASDKMFAAVPKPMQSDPAYLFAKVEKLMHGEKFKEAAALMLGAPRDPARLVDGDEWWAVQRTLARKMLDLGENKIAYRLCAEAAPISNPLRIEAEFQAGWIALRFLDHPDTAAEHFAAAALRAETPISIARAAYWQGRAAEASHDPAVARRAKDFYATAAAQSATYYGQLAREKLGLKSVLLRDIEPAAIGMARDDSVRAVELLYALGEKELAFPLAEAAAQHLTSQSQLAALAKIVAAQRDAHASLTIGKILALRRIAVDSLAFPTYGVPDFDPVENSASPALVYAIARQESAFDSKAISSAGAKGLMQMIAATAKRTAERAGLYFDPAKLTDDAAFNAKLGAAHLGELLKEEKGCPILVFAAYNAGGHRVKQWIAAYGDPRSPEVDPVDWVERIPFAETRNYVQRVMENLTIYEVRFGEGPRNQMLREMIHAKL